MQRIHFETEHNMFRDSFRAFLQKVAVGYPLMVFETGGTAALRRLGNATGGLPYTLLLDAEGRVAHTILGQVDPAALAARLPKSGGL